LSGLSRFTSIRILILFVFHAVVFSSCYLLAWLVRFEFEMPAVYVGLMQSSLPFVVGMQLLVGALFGFYRGWWRYVGIADVNRLVLGMFTALALVVTAWYSGTFLGLEERLVKAP